MLGLGAASLTKKQAEKIVKDLVKRNAVTVKEGKEMLNKVRKQALNQGNKIRKLAEKETKRMTKDLGVVSKDQVVKIKKILKSLDKELSTEGKKLLKKISK